MAGQKKFKTSLFGYKKQDVYDFIEKLAKDLEEQIKVKDDELISLRQQNKDLKEKVEELSQKLNEMENDRTYIAKAIIKAEEQAKCIIEEAISDAERKKEELRTEINYENDKLEQVKQELKELKLNAINAVKRYEMQLVEMIGQDEEAAATVEVPLQEEMVEIDKISESED